MSDEPKGKDRMTFGGIGEDGKICLCEFCPDPDGTNLRWFKPTGGKTSLDGLVLLDTKTKEYHGRCYDTGKFYSHTGELLYELIEEAPERTTLAVFETSWSCGTKTFTDYVTVEFYGKKEEEAKESTDG